MSCWRWADPEPSLAVQVRLRLVAAGIGPDDPGLAEIREWNGRAWRPGVLAEVERIRQQPTYSASGDGQAEEPESVDLVDMLENRPDAVTWERSR